MRYLSLIFITIFGVLTFFSFGLMARAQSCPGDYQQVSGICVPKTQGTGFASTTDYFQLIRKIINVMLQIAGALSVLLVVYGGIIYMTAGSSDEQAKKGKTAIQYALIGIVIIVLSYAIVNLVVTFVLGK